MKSRQPLHAVTSSSIKRLRFSAQLGLIVSIFCGIFCIGENSLSEQWSAFCLGINSSDSEAVIMWWVRIPQLIITLCAGAVLATSGAAMQHLMRNELADPYLIGVAAGGGLGAALSISSGLVDQFGTSALALCSFLGALCSSLWIDRRAKQLQKVHMGDESTLLVLAGVALNLFLSALLTLIISLSGDRVGNIWRWLVGHIPVLSWWELSLVLFLSALSLKILIAHSRELSLLDNGYEVAWSLGVPLNKLRSLVLISTSLGVGIIVSYCGIIGFIGLLVPHFIRPLIGGHSQHLLSLSMLFGALSLVLCHLCTLVLPFSIPIGVITGVIGGGTFFFTLSHQLKRSESY